MPHSLSAQLTLHHPCTTRSLLHPRLPPQEGGSDPFKSRAVRHFRAHYQELLDRVVQEAHAGDVLFDDYMTDKISNLAIALAWWVGRVAVVLCCAAAVLRLGCSWAAAGLPGGRWQVAGCGGPPVWLGWTEADSMLHQTDAMRTACT